MAFAKQYYSSYKSNNNLDYYLEIFVEGFDSSATEITIGAGGPVISYETDQEDRFSPILSSQCILPFMVKDTSTQAFIQLLRTTYQEREVYLHLYRATSSTYTTTKPIWSGFLVMDLGSGEDVSFPYEQKLTFVDGLSLLKDIDFVDLSNEGSETNIQGSYTKENMYYGPAIYTYWIKEILLKTGCAISGVNGQGVSIDYGFTTAVNWYNADMQNTNQGSDPLGLTQCIVSMFHTKNDQDVFTPQNCYTVLKELLRHWGARITYWKHEFWIVQIPEYIQDESGLIDNPDNINSRQYNRFGTLTGSQDHLGDTYYTRYEQTIQSNQVSKLVGTKYNYLPMIHNAEADFLSFASKNYYGGFPYGVSAESQEVFQGTIIDPSTANFLWLSVPLNWVWDMSGSSLSHHQKGWWCSVKFNFYASDGTTTYYLQYDSSNGGSYYWVLEADWTPLGNTSPKYIIKSTSLTESNYIGFQEDIPFVDSSGSAIAMTGAWSFFLDIEDFANQSSSGNSGSFYCRFSGYAPSSHYSYVKKDPFSEFPYLPTTGDVSGGGLQTKSGTVSWSNTLENPSGVLATSFSTPVGFDAGTSQADIQFVTSSPFKGFLQTLNTTQSASFGLSLNSQINNSTNTEKFSFGTLLWGDAIQQFAVGCLRVNNGSSFVKTNPDGEWGRGTLSGDNTFTELLIDEFLSGQIKVVISPAMRLAVGEENKNQTGTGTSGSATRPRYVNPIGRLRESRTNETDPEYIFRRGSFHSLYDEWDYEGYQILRDTVSSTTTTTDIGDLGGTQDNNPISNAKLIGNVNNALMMNSPVAYLRTTVPATGSNVAVNGNFNVATGWTVGTGWSIDTTNKKASFTATGSTSDLTQSVLTQGLTYQVNFQVLVTAGSLLVKAGSSGTTQTITTSGDYSIYLDCDGSNLIKFQAATTFTGNITFITLRDQKSLSSVPINSIGSTVFKTNDTFNLVNSLGGEILTLTATSNQGATDDTISVTSTALFDDIGIDSVLLINQDDLSAQYQNKTKGSVAGFDITTTGIAKSSINITDWLNSDTMTGAAITNVPTALSVKNYIDGQAGHDETLAQVLVNGNTTSGTDIIVSHNDTLKLGDDGEFQIWHQSGASGNSFIDETNTGDLYIRSNSAIRFSHYANNTASGIFYPSGGVELYYNTAKKFETTSTGISITGGGVFTGDLTLNTGSHLFFDGGNSGTYIVEDIADRLRIFVGATEFARFTESSSDTIIFFKDTTLSGSLTGITATFTGLVSGITPTVDANLTTKGYVDTKVASIPKGLSYQGTWNASTNTPTIVSSVGTAGYYWIVSVEGTTTIDGVSDWKVGDWIIFSDGGVYQKIDQSEGDTLQTVTTRGSTTTTGISIGGDLTITGAILNNVENNYLDIYGGNDTTNDAHIRLNGNASNWGSIEMNYGYDSTNSKFIVKQSSTEVFKLEGGNATFQGDVEIRTGKKLILQRPNNGVATEISTDSTGAMVLNSINSEGFFFNNNGTNIFKLDPVNATFTGLVSGITPTQNANFTTKSYVDAQIGANDSLEEVTSVGNSTSYGIVFTSTNFSIGQAKIGLYSNNLVYLRGGSSGLMLQNGDGSTALLMTTDHIFEVGSAEKMRLTSGGNLGVGTATPNEKIQVAGNIHAFAPSGIDAGLFASSAAASTTIAIRSNGITHFNGGSVGVGTSSPNATLAITSDGATSDYAFTVEDSNNNQSFYIQDGGRIGVRYYPFSIGIPNSTAVATNAVFQVEEAGLLTVLSTGNVGISTVSPATPLHVVGTARFDANDGIKARGVYANYFASGQNLTLNCGADGNIIFDDGSERARITSGGNLLISTSNDDGSSKLQVNGNINLFSSNDANIARGQIKWSTSQGTSRSFIKVGGSYGANDLEFGTGNAVLGMILHANQGLSIGSGATTIAPSNGLRVTGATILTDSLTGTTAIFNGSFISVNNSSGNSQVLLTSAGSCEVDILNAQSEAYLRTITNHDLHFRTNNTNKMVIKTSGNVLIGTTSDDGSSKLQVLGDVTAGNASTSAKFKAFHSDGEYTEQSGIGLTLSRGNSYIQASVDNSKTLNIGQSSVRWGHVKVDSATFKVLNGGNERLGIDSSGDATFSGAVGIGVAGGTNAQLEVVATSGEVFRADSSGGAFRVVANQTGVNTQGVLAHTGTATFSGNVTFPSNKGLEWGNGSTVRVESNVLKLGASGGIDLQAAITGITATFKGTDVGATDNLIIQNSAGTKTFSVSNNGAVNIDGSQKIITSDASIELRNNQTGLMLFKSASNYGITFGDNGGESMRINTSTNNILIGTTSDNGAKLQIAGNLTAISSSIAAYFRSSGGTSYVQGAIAIESSNLDTPEARGQGVFMFNQGKDSTWYMGTRYNNADEWQVGRAADTSLATISATTAKAFLKINNVGAATFSGEVTLGTNGGGERYLRLESDTASSYLEFQSLGNVARIKATNNTNLLFQSDGSGGYQTWNNNGAERMRLLSNGNFLVGTSVDAGVKLYVDGVIRSVNGSIQTPHDFGFQIADASGSNRFGLKMGSAGSQGDSNLMMLTNRSYRDATGGGQVAIAGNSNTSGVTEVEITRFDARASTAAGGVQSKVSMDSVLELTAQETPADPASGKSVIWMTTAGDLKVKITTSSGTVTRTIVTYE